MTVVSGNTTLSQRVMIDSRTVDGECNKASDVRTDAINGKSGLSLAKVVHRRAKVKLRHHAVEYGFHHNQHFHVYSIV